jgi:hypothetical protein
MDQVTHRSVALKEPIPEGHQLPGLISKATDLSSLPVRLLIDAWLQSMAANSFVPFHLFEKVENECANVEDLSYVLHIEALMFHYSGDMDEAISRAHRCLDLSSRIGNRLLEADVLLHMGKMYETLGHRDLGAEYLSAAEQMRTETGASGNASAEPA